MGNCCLVSFFHRLSVRLFESKYEIEDKGIGWGKFGDVYPCRERVTGKVLIARKLLIEGIPPEKRSAVHDSCRNRSHIDHVNVVKCCDSVYDQQYRYIVYEKPQGKKLFQEICGRDQYSESDARNYARQILSAIAYLHRHEFIHGRVQPANLHLRSLDDTITLVDHGLSSESHYDEERPYAALESKIYMAPEMFQTGAVGETSDEWSCGVILYNLLGGIHYIAFQDVSSEDVINQITRNSFLEFPAPEFIDVTQQSMSLVRRLMIRDQHSRITAAEALLLDDLHFSEVGRPWTAHRQITLDRLRLLCNYVGSSSVRSPESTSQSSVSAERAGARLPYIRRSSSTERLLDFNESMESNTYSRDSNYESESCATDEGVSYSELESGSCTDPESNNIILPIEHGDTDDDRPLLPNM